MTHEDPPYVEVEMRASRICYLSQESRFDFVLLLTLCNSEEPCICLKAGFENTSGLHSVNSAEFIQCLDDNSGKQPQVLRQDAQPSFLRLEPNRAGYVTFTTSTTPRLYELPFVTSSLEANKTYMLGVKPTTSITHWSPRETSYFQTLSHDIPFTPPSGHSLPQPSPNALPFHIPHGKPSLTFSTRPTPPHPPKLSVSLSAPRTFSLSSNPPYTFRLTFSIHPPQPITILAQRQHVRALDSDIEIIRPSTNSRLGPTQIDDGDDDGELVREDLLRIEGTYVETRVLDLGKRVWEDVGRLVVGEEYVLRCLGGKWKWWSEDSVEEVLDWVKDGGSSGMAFGEREAVEYEGAGEARVRVVE